MSFEQWLNAATHGLPASARSCLEREYAAHLEDSAACSQTDTLSVLGRPEAVRQSLRRLYLSASELSWRNSGHSIGMWINSLGILAVFALTLAAPSSALPFWSLAVLPAISLLLFGIAYLLTLHLEYRQRAFVMDSVCVLLCCALPAVLIFSLLPRSGRWAFLLADGWQLIALLGLGVLSLASMFWQESKLRRTLALGAA